MLRPGLTGLAQIPGFRGATGLETDVTARLQADLEYINGWTSWRNVRIALASTMVLFHERAFQLRTILPRPVAAVMKREVRQTGLHALPDGRRIAFRQVAGIQPAIVFLPGYQSDMAGSKAIALFEWAERNRRGCLLLDYSGCGESSGEFAEGTLTRWCDEVVALSEARLGGQVILVGSSMGGWLMLLAARRLGERVAAMVGIAAAPDFTDWGFDDRQKAQLAAGKTLRQDNPYGPEPTLVHPGFWADGESLHVLDGAIPFDGPVRLLHGLDDSDVPPEISLRLAAALRSQDVQVTLVKGGDHRLSREQDIALLLRTVAELT